MERLARLHIRVVPGQVEHEAIGLDRAADRAALRLELRGDIAAPVLERRRRLHPLGEGLAIEGLGCREGLVDEGLRNAVIGEVEEADPLAGLADLGGDGGALLRPAGKEGAEIDHGNVGDIDRLRLLIGLGQALDTHHAGHAAHHGMVSLSSWPGAAAREAW